MLRSSRHCFPDRGRADRSQRSPPRPPDGLGSAPAHPGIMTCRGIQGILRYLHGDGVVGHVLGDAGPHHADDLLYVGGELVVPRLRDRHKFD